MRIAPNEFPSEFIGFDCTAVWLKMPPKAAAEEVKAKPNFLLPTAKYKIGEKGKGKGIRVLLSPLRRRLLHPTPFVLLPRFCPATIGKGL